MPADESQNSPMSSILEGVGFFVIGKVASNLLGFGSNFLLTHGLGASVYGMYTLAQTMSRMVGSVSNLGSDKAVLRYVSSEEFAQSDYFGVSYATALVGSLIAGTLLFVLAPVISSFTFTDHRFVLVLRAFAFALVLRQMFIITGNGFRAIDRPGLDSLLQQVIQQGSLVAFLGIAYVLSVELIGYLSAMVLAVGTTTIAGIVLLVRSTRFRPTFSIRNVNLKSYLTYSLPLSLKDAGSTLYTRVDILLLGLFVTSSTVGHYQIAVLLTGFLTLPLSGVNRIFPPVISRLYTEGDKETTATVYKTATRWVLTGTLPAMLGLIIYRDQILSLFGPSFTEASLVLVLLSAGQLFNASVGPTGYLLMMSDRQFVLLANQWVFGIINVVLNVVLISSMGAIGAAVATATVLATLNLVRVAEAVYLEQVHPFSYKLAKPIAACIVSGATMFAAHMISSSLPGMVIGGTLGIIVFVSSLWVLGLEEDDVELVREFTG